MKFFSVLTKKEYHDDKGKLQSVWYKAGFIKQTPNGGQYLQLYHLPTTPFFVVPQEQREEVIQFDPA